MSLSYVAIRRSQHFSALTFPFNLCSDVSKEELRPEEGWILQGRAQAQQSWRGRGTVVNVLADVPSSSTNPPVIGEGIFQIMEMDDETFSKWLKENSIDTLSN